MGRIKRTFVLFVVYSYLPEDPYPGSPDKIRLDGSHSLRKIRRASAAPRTGRKNDLQKLDEKRLLRFSSNFFFSGKLREIIHPGLYFDHRQEHLEGFDGPEGVGDVGGHEDGFAGS